MSRFIYENLMGDYLEFEENDLIKAIYIAWNIEANLYLVQDKSEKLIFSPIEDNDFNSELLSEFGYSLIDGKEEREIFNLKTKSIVKYDFKDI